MAVTLSDLNKQLKSQNETLENTDKNIGKISKNLSAFIAILTSDPLQDRENELEKSRGSSNGSGPGGRGGIGEDLSAAEAGLFGGIGAMLSRLIPSFSTLVAGFTGLILASFSEMLNDVARTYAAAFLGLGKTLKGLWAATKIGPTIIKAFTSVTTAFMGILGFVKTFDIITKEAVWVQKFPTTSVSKFFGLLGKIFNPIVKFISGPTMKIIGGLGKYLGMFAVVLKKIFLPIGLIFTAYDVIKNSLKEFERAGWVGAFTGAISGLFSSIIGAPLNLIKEIGLFIGEKLGFLSPEDKEKYSKELNFEKIILDAGKAVADWLNTLPEKFSKLIDVLTPDWMKTDQGTRDEQNQANEYDESGGIVPVDSYYKGTQGVTGKLFKNFGSGTPAMLHGEEAVIPKNSGLGQFLGKMMTAAGPMAKFGYQKGTELEAKEAAMRAAGASDMDIAQSMMGDMGSIMTGLKGAVSAGGLDKLQMPNLDTTGVKRAFEPSNVGNMFGTMVRESEEAKRRQSVAPVVIADNSTRVNNRGSSQTTLAVPSTVYDFDDPLVKGLRWV